MSVGHFSGGQMSQHPTLSNSSKASLNSACCILSKSPIINKINNNSNKTLNLYNCFTTLYCQVFSLPVWVAGAGLQVAVIWQGGHWGYANSKEGEAEADNRISLESIFHYKENRNHESEYPWKVCPGMTLLFMLIWRIRKECFNKYISTGNIYQSEWIHKDKVCKFVFLNSRASFQWVGLQTKGKCTKYFAMINKVRIYIIFLPSSV